MQINEKYLNKDGDEFEIHSNGELVGVGPLNDLYRILFSVTKDENELFRAAIDIDDFFLKTINVPENYKPIDDRGILLRLALLKIKCHIEKKVFENLHFVFSKNTIPYDLRLAIAQLNNELSWERVLLVQDNTSRKYVVFNNHRHWIPNTITRNALGYREERFIRLTDIELSKYPASDNIEDIKDVRLIRNENDPSPVFALFNIPALEKRHVPNPPTLDAIGRKQDEVAYLSPEEFSAFPTGKDILSVNHWDVPVPRVTDQQELEYEVALSYASEDFPYVQKVADILRDNKVKYYLDKHEDMWGKDLSVTLQAVYEKKSGYVVPFISSYYANKVWPNFEFQNALSKAVQLKREYILPVRFDKTELPGLRASVVYLDANKYPPEEIANRIISKLRT
ncbi:MAG: TIR domain-containing protein [bacterium]